MTSKSLSSRLAVISALIVTMAGSIPVGAQTSFRANIDYINDQQFPLIEAYVSLSDDQSQPIGGLTEDNFTVSEDSLSIEPLLIKEFENTEQPLAIALAVDTSGSMRSSLDKAVDAAKTFVDQLTAKDQVAVIKFADSPSVVQQLTADKNAVKSALDQLKPEGQHTTIYDATIEAANVLKDYSGRRIIVLVTDGRDMGTGVFDFDRAIDQARDLSIPIYPLGFGSGLDRNILTQMAELTGGVIQIRPSDTELQASFDSILRLLREQYLIRYISSFRADEKQHSLMVTATHQGSQIQASRFFTARSSQIPVTLRDYEADQVVGGLVRFEPKMDWPAPIKKLDIVVDAFPLASIQEEPFVYEWDSTETEQDIPIGTHEFKFTFTDIAGNTGRASIRLNVQPPITVQITEPNDGSTVSGSTSIKAEVTSLSDIQLGKVEISVDGQMIGAPLTSLPYQARWESNVAGIHTITVTGFDMTGQFKGSDEIVVNMMVGTYSWMVALIVLLAVVGLTIPLAVRARKRMGHPAGTATKPGQASLREINGLNPNQVWPLGVNEVRLGRKRDENDIPLQGLKASRKHAVIRYEKGQYVIYSLNVENPVIVNNMPIAQSHILHQGDEIRLGDTVLKYE